MYWHVAGPQVVLHDCLCGYVEQFLGQGRLQLVALTAPSAGQDPAGRPSAALEAAKVAVCWPVASEVLTSQMAEQTPKVDQEPQVQLLSA